MRRLVTKLFTDFGLSYTIVIFIEIFALRNFITE
jgi:hypothetical protein